MVCTILYSLTFIADLATKGALHLAGEHIYGYTITEDAVGAAAWLLSLALLHREKVLVVTSKPHGLTVASFWLLDMVWLGLQLVSFQSPAWWWQLTNRRGDIADLTLFLVRVVIIMVLVVLGLLRPLCCPGRRKTYSLLINADSAAVDSSCPEASEVNVENSAEARRRKEGDFVRNRTTSAFSNIWLKIRLLFPYVWPKGVKGREVGID